MASSHGMAPPVSAPCGAAPPTLYALLGVGPEASTEELRQAYRKAALAHHPDKAAAAAAAVAAAAAAPAPQPAADTGGGSCGDVQQPDAQATTAAGGEEAAERFLAVQAAWEVLADPAARAAYDRQLALDASRQELHINEWVALSEMDLGPDGEGVDIEGEPCAAWPCRCGGRFLLPLAECGGLGDAPGAATAAAEVVVPCSTCSLHIQVTTGR